VTRDRKLIAGFTAIAVAAATAVGLHVAQATPPLETVSRQVTLQQPGHLSVTFLGDTMLADGAKTALDANGYDWPFQLSHAVLGADFTIANAEAPISDRTVVANPLKPFSYAASSLAAPALARAGVDALGLANNHAMDLGPAGMVDTVNNVGAAGVATFGAGLTLKSAQRPLLLRSPAGTLAVVAIGENFGKNSTATDSHPGTLALSAATVQRGVDVARAAGADWVVAYVHWGDNYQPVVPEQRAYAQAFAAAGYDMVIGTGPHVVQPITMVAGMPVAYSIGNFSFGSPGRYKFFHALGYGLALRLDLSRDRAARISVTCLATDNAVVAYQARPCTQAQSSQLFPTVSTQLTPLGADTALLNCDCLGRPPRRRT
jgi:poly-gamma-glutamate synthesis protein (capsule biosynthesis protein)